MLRTNFDRGAPRHLQDVRREAEAAWRKALRALQRPASLPRGRGLTRSRGEEGRVGVASGGTGKSPPRPQAAAPGSAQLPAARPGRRPRGKGGAERWLGLAGDAQPREAGPDPA